MKNSKTLSVNKDRYSVTTLKIEGMSCASCVTSVEKSIASVKGVKDVNVNYATEEAVVTHHTSVNTIIEAVESAGYTAQSLDQPDKEANDEQTAKLNIEGMSCASCVAHVEKALLNTSGVTRADVNLATNSAKVSYVGSDINELLKSVEDTGYKASIDEGTEHVTPRLSENRSKFKRRFLIALPIAALVMIFDMAPMLNSAFSEAVMPYITLWNSFLMVLTGIVLFYAGSSFFTGAWKATFRKTADMNTLIAVGTGAAFLFSVYATFFGRHGSLVTPMDVYFDTAAVIIALVLLGRWMEEQAKYKSKDALTGLLELTPQIANKVAESGEIQSISLKQVHVGDVLLVKAWEQIPVDGVIIEGHASIDESMMTGESLPVEKKENEAVIGATRNTSRAFKMRATQVGADTAFSKIIATVKEAQGSKAPIQRLVDKVASIFVPIVIIIALMTLVVWLLVADPAQAIVNMVAVLVIACPCALGLATPTGIMIGSGRAAQKGILIKDAVTLEEAKAIKTIIFDKTGTLTTGKMEVTEIKAQSGFDQEQILTWAAAVERQSDHPIARSIVNYASSKNLKLTEAYNVETLTGLGITGIVNGKDIAVGSYNTFKEYTSEQLEYIHHQQSEGKTVLVVKADDILAAFISVSDIMKDDAPAVIEKLKSMGIEPIMVTGDQERTARAIAKLAGIDKVEAGISPDGKAAIVKKYQDLGKEVAMVGDGINDAAALVQADLSIAMSTGTDIAVSSSDITLLGGDLSKVVEAITLSKGILRIIRQNLFWAFIYNTVGIPLAALGFLSPIIAAAAMALSSVSVVGNSLRIRHL
ncbi:MAG: heavy metal translocating P-type ATPase [Balneolales bacterium]